MRYDTLLILLLAGVLGLTGCAEEQFAVENPNAPDRERALTDASDLQAVLDGGYTSFWNATYETLPAFVPAPILHGWGDAMTTTNAYSGFWGAATDEPRREFQNTLSYAELHIVEGPWQNLNASVSSANDVIREIEINDFQIEIDGEDQTPRTLASAYFLRGLAYGHLANLFDQAYITTEEFDPEVDEVEFSPYTEVLDQAKSDFEQAREIARNNSFQLRNVLPWSQAVSSDRLIRIANSFEARHIISNPRTASEAQNIDWGGEVRPLVENGIEEDLVMDLDGNNWYSYWSAYSGVQWYWRVDNRIVQKMAAQHGVDYPIKYPADEAGTAIDPAKTFAQEGEGDARLCPATGEEFEGSGVSTAAELDCYFVYDTDQSGFREARGRTLQSNYWYGRDFVREQYFNSPFAAGPWPIFLQEENRLMRAEVEMQTGNKSEAIDIINNGSRVNVGELDPLAEGATNQEVMDAIYYERDVELYRTGLGLPYFDLRRRGMLQAGTPLHMPVPATELQTIGEEIYTFGGASNAGQPGTASGDNAWCDQGDFSCDGPFEAPNNAPQAEQSNVTLKAMHEFGLMSPSKQPASK